MLLARNVRTGRRESWVNQVLGCNFLTDGVDGRKTNKPTVLDEIKPWSSINELMNV